LAAHQAAKRLSSSSPVAAPIRYAAAKGAARFTALSTTMDRTAVKD